MKRRRFLQSLGIGAGVGIYRAAWPGTGLGAGAAESSAAVLLEGFPLHKQETPYTCGPAAARMVLEYLGHPVAEAEIKRRMRTNPATGTLPSQEVRGLNEYLAEFKTGLKAKTLKGAEVANEVVLQSLRQKLPVIASFLTENFFKPGTLVGHYAVIIGLDPPADEFTLANPFGSIMKIATARFWRLAEWRPQPGDLPESVKGRKPLPVPFKRTIIILRKERL